MTMPKMRHEEEEEVAGGSDLPSAILEINDAITMRTTPARRGELLAELGHARANARTGHEGVGHPIPTNPFGPMRRMLDPVAFGLAPASRTGADICRCV